MTVTFTGEIHPVAALFPMLADDELVELAEDIAARGLLQPIVLDAEGRLLDGRNRLAACEKAGIEPTFTVYEGKDPNGYALTVNITRRHLTTGARAVLAAQAARLNGASYKSVTGDEAKLNKVRLSEAALVLDWAPARVPEIFAGVMPLSRAVEEARAAKRDAEALEANLTKLRTEAKDLALLVDEERMSVNDALAALKGRADEAEQEAREAERRRAEEQRDARTLLDRVLVLAAPTDMDDTWADAWAERLGDVPDDLVTRTEQAGQLLLNVAERLRR